MTELEVYKDYYEYAPVMFVSVDPKTARIKECNQTLVETLGYSSKKEIIGNDLDFVYHPACHDLYRAAFQLFQKDGVVRNFKLILRKKDGSPLSVLLNVTPVKDSEGNIIRSRSSWTDISDYTEKERLLERYSLAVDGISVGLWDWFDVNKSEEYWSPKFYELLGYRDREVEASLENFSSFLHPDDRDRTFTAVGSHFKDKLPFDIEYRLRTKKGAYRWFKGTGQVSRDSDGKPTRMVGSIQDIHEQKTLEMQLRAQNRTLKFITEEANDGWWDWRVQENYEYMSPKFWKTFGIDPRTKSDDPSEWGGIIHPDDLKMTQENFKRHCESKGKYPYQQEVRYKHSAGHWVTVFCRGAVVEWGEKGEPIRMIGTHVDITALKLAEAERKRIRRRLEVATESARIGIWELDVRNNELIWDDRMYELYGVREEDFGGAVEAWEKALHADDAERAQKEFQDALANVKDFNTEFRVVWPSGRVRHIKADAYVTRDKDGNPLFITGTNYDITEKKEQETALLESNKELSQFAYVVSHDLQAPLRHIESYAKKMVDKVTKLAPDEELGKWMKFVETSVKRMKALISDLLSYSRLGGKALSFEKVSLNGILDTVLVELTPEIQAKKAEVAFGDLGTVKCNRTMITQVFQNLIQNALKFAKSDTPPRIEVTCEEERARYVLSVKDNGIGIKEEYQEKIFQVFQRLHSKEEYEGTGIGLSIFRRIVQVHGGEFWVESTIGEGSAFRFSLPKGV